MSREWHFKIFEESYDAIVDGTKTVETRPPDSDKDIRDARAGDILVLTPYTTTRKQVIHKPVLRVSITAVRSYATVRSMLETEGFARIRPNDKTIEESVAWYASVPGFAERIEKYGIVAMDIR